MKFHVSGGVQEKKLKYSPLTKINVRSVPFREGGVPGKGTF